VERPGRLGTLHDRTDGALPLSALFGGDGILIRERLRVGADMVTHLVVGVVLGLGILVGMIRRNRQIRRDMSEKEREQVNNVIDISTRLRETREEAE